MVSISISDLYFPWLFVNYNIIYVSEALALFFSYLVENFEGVSKIVVFLGSIFDH